MPQIEPNPSQELPTPLGPIFVSAIGFKTAIVNAPQLMVDGIAVSATATLVRGDTSDFDFLKQVIPADQNGPLRFAYADNALRANFANGRVVDLPILGKIADVIAPAVRQFAAARDGRRFFLEAERRILLGTIEGLAHQVRPAAGICYFYPS